MLDQERHPQLGVCAAAGTRGCRDQAIDGPANVTTAPSRVSQMEAQRERLGVSAAGRDDEGHIAGARAFSERALRGAGGAIMACDEPQSEHGLRRSHERGVVFASRATA